jgi:hypothetical protein
MPSVATDAPILHFDAGEILKHQITPEGYLRCYMRIAKVGDLTYMNPDGSKRVEIVTPEVLFNKDSIDSFKMKPITLEHPAELVNSRNARKYQRGLTGHHAVIDSNFLGLVGTITDREMVDSVLRGDTQETSCGYEAAVNHSDGKFFQGFRKGNHVAGTRKGRAGEEIGFHIDSVDEYWSLLKDDAWREDYDESFVDDVLQVPSKTKFFTQSPDALVKDSVEPLQSASADQPQPKGKQPMTYPITVGNRPIVLDSADDAAAINAMLAENSALKAKLDAKKMADDEDDDYEDDEDEDDEEMKDKNGKPLPAFIRKKMAKKDSLIEELRANLDALTTEVETKDGELAVLQAIVGRTDSEEEPAERMDSDEIEALVQKAITDRLDALEDCRPYLPADFKFDSAMTPADLKQAAIAHFDNELQVEGEAAINAAYQTIKRVANKRQDSSTQLNNVLYQTLPNPAVRQDSQVLSIEELARLDSADDRIKTLDPRRASMLRSYQAGRAKITPGVN